MKFYNIKTFQKGSWKNIYEQAVEYSHIFGLSVLIL